MIGSESNSLRRQGRYGCRNITKFGEVYGVNKLNNMFIQDLGHRSRKNNILINRYL